VVAEAAVQTGFCVVTAAAWPTPTSQYSENGRIDNQEVIASAILAPLHGRSSTGVDALASRFGLKPLFKFMVAAGYAFGTGEAINVGVNEGIDTSFMTTGQRGIGRACSFGGKKFQTGCTLASRWVIGEFQPGPEVGDPTVNVDGTTLTAPGRTEAVRGLP